MIKEKKSKNIYIVTLMVVILECIMKFIGFVKQSVVAYYYGANAQMDVYFVASDFINGFSNAIIASAKVAVIGVYTAVRCKEGRNVGINLISTVFEWIVCITTIMCLLMTLFSELLVFVLAPAFSNQLSEQLSIYINQLSGVVILIGLAMVLESVLNSHEIYYATRYRSLIYSLCVIVSCVFFSERFDIYALIVTQYIAFVVYIIFLLFSGKKYIKFKLCNPFKSSHMRTILMMMVPVLIGNSVIYINYWIDNAIASSLDAGAVSALSYSHVLDSFFVSVLITSITSILFSHFANLVAKEDIEKIRSTLSNCLSILIFVFMPIAVLVFFEAREIVEIVYFRGNFTYDTVVVTALALQGYAIRYPFAAVRDVLVQGLYAYKNTRTPMITSIISAIVNVVVSLIAVSYIGIFAISLGTSISAIVGMMINMYALKKQIPEYRFERLREMMCKSFVAIIVCAIILLIQSKYFQTGQAFLDLIVAFFITETIYCFCMLLMKDYETRRLLKIFFEKMKGYAARKSNS